VCARRGDLCLVPALIDAATESASLGALRPCSKTSVKDEGNCFLGIAHGRGAPWLRSLLVPLGTAVLTFRDEECGLQGSNHGITTGNLSIRKSSPGNDGPWSKRTTPGQGTLRVWTWHLHALSVGSVTRQSQSVTSAMGKSLLPRGKLTPPIAAHHFAVLLDAVCPVHFLRGSLFRRLRHQV